MALRDDIGNPRGLPSFDELDLSFDIIDSHHHLFNLEQVYYPWLTDHPDTHFLLGNYDAIKKNYSADNYLADVGDLNVVKTVHVEAEADHENSISETRWLATAMNQHPIPNAIVAHAWLHRDDTRAVLAAHAEFSAVRGIRSKPVTSVTARERHSVNGVASSFQDPHWRRGLGLLSEFNLSWDLRVPFWHLEDAVDVCDLYPSLPVVVEHTGLPWDRSDGGLSLWRTGMRMLAQRDNVCVKISELGLANDPWDYEDNKRVVLETVALFGFDRCMFASNFPVAGLRINYRDQVCAIAHMVKDCSAYERQQLFQHTAARFYRL